VTRFENRDRSLLRHRTPRLLHRTGAAPSPDCLNVRSYELGATARTGADVSDPGASAPGVLGGSRAHDRARGLSTTDPEHPHHPHGRVTRIDRHDQSAPRVHADLDKDFFHPPRDCGKPAAQGNCPGVNHWIVGGGDAAVLEKWVLTDAFDEVPGDPELVRTVNVEGWDVLIYRFPDYPAGSVNGGHWPPS
jgi:hypothetical protein